MRDLRVLVVDDSKVGRVTLVRKLEPLGVQVDTVESGQQALDYLANTRPDVIFMDHMMPDMDGFEVTRRIKAAPATRDIPVVIVSGNDEAEFVQEAHAAGAIDAIAKPPGPGVLEAILASLAQPAAAPEPAPAIAEPAREPAVDLAALRALVDDLLGKAMDGMRDELAAHADIRMETESAKQQARLKDWDGHWRTRADQLAADVAALRRDLAGNALLDTRLNALEQRLPPLEAQAGKPPPDFEPARRELQAGLDDLRTLGEQRAGGLVSRIDTLSADISRLAGDTQTTRTELAGRVDEIRQRLDRIEAAPPAGAEAETLLVAVEQRLAHRIGETGARLDALAAQVDAQRARQDAAPQPRDALDDELAARLETLSARVDELGSRPAAWNELQARCDALEHRLDAVVASQHADSRLAIPSEADNARLTDIQAEVADLGERLSEPRLRQLVAQTVREIPPDAAARPETEAPGTPRPDEAGDGRLQAEVEGLRGKVKTLTLALALGGALVLAVLGALLLGR